MKTLKLIIPVAAVLLLAGQAAAQTEAAQATREVETREAEVAKRLQEAERRMAEAAREIAELTAERLPELGEIEKRIKVLKSDRPRLGVTIGDKDSEGPVAGVRIMAVTPGSAADDAGLRADDILTAVNEESLSADSAKDAAMSLRKIMEGVEEGDVLGIEYLRDGKVGTVEVEPRAIEMHKYSFGGFPEGFTMPKMPPNVHISPDVIEKYANAYKFRWAGNTWGDMELVELNEGLGKYFGTDSGILVVSAPKSDALKLEDGDVIRKIDDREPTSVRHALRILSSYQPGETLALEIMRDRRSRTLEIEMPDDRSSMVWPMPVPAPRPATAPLPAPKPALAIEKT